MDPDMVDRCGILAAFFMEKRLLYKSIWSIRNLKKPKIKRGSRSWFYGGNLSK